MASGTVPAIARMKLTIPDPALILLIGTSGSGKSTFARKHFQPTEILSSDQLRGWLADDERDQSVNADVFAVLHLIAAKRLGLGKLTVIDATNVQAEARQPLLKLARQRQVPAIAIVFKLPESLCIERDQQRAARHVGPTIIHEQFQHLQQSLITLPREKLPSIFVLSSLEEVEAVTIERVAISP